MLGEHMGRGDDDGANLMQGQHHYPPLITALQNKHHGVVLADAERQQIGSCLICLLLQLSVGGSYLFALVVGPKDR